MTPNDLIATAIQRERLRKGISLSALASSAGLAKSTLSQLEAGKGNPGIETLWAIAGALEVNFSTLFEMPDPETTLVRAGEGHGLGAEQADYQTVLLSNCGPGMRRDIYRADLEPGTIHQSNPHPHGAIEHVIICNGQAKVGPKGAEETLTAGDYYRYGADRPHGYEALEPGTQMIVVMELRD